MRHHERLRVDWIDVDGMDDWPVTPPCPKWVDVIAKKSSEKCVGMNFFVERMIFESFEHDKEKGWKLKTI